ncbi:uncharacterized protein BDFB_006990 [Asbolus verrucosus]|uniref:Uncharacterized protein n=1 Tax=Asbolus verrucosus TaxID=1661398 RepID=A0A482WD43_ASBVE|nr:uncharacterized protein BDFB_006990 [Asbolus verrucosus]
MSSGAGRGRGWLNLGKNAEPPRPMGLARPPANPTPVQQVECKYKGLIEKVKEMNVSDDGIMFNKKLQYIQTYWVQECGSREDVEGSFEELYNACLHDAELASKLVALVASRSCISQEIHECNLRHQFLKHLQKDFENSNQLQTTSPLMFRNCVHMLGEFYSKARSSKGELFNILATPLLSCLELLLTSKSLADLTLFTTQLFLNGSTLKTTEPEDLAKLSIKIRTVVVGELQLVKEAKLWLLLALDLYNVRFGVLAPEVYKFYEDQLGSAAMVNFQKPHDTLSIQTLHSSKVLDSFQSNVNVLQISTSPTEAPQNEHPPQNSGFSKDASTNKEKTGRPILGVGARFIKNKSSDENGTWNSKSNSASGRVHTNKKPPTLKNNKGWEHDDRFENDYN